MAFQEDLLFWQLAHHFIVQSEYRILQLSNDHKELWLEKIESKNAGIIRLVNVNLDWSNWLKRDIEFCALNGEKIRNKIGRRGLTIMNIYITPFPPVDDYEGIINIPYVNPLRKKTIINTIILDQNGYLNSLVEMEKLLETKLDFQLKENYTEFDIQGLRYEALLCAENRAKKEKSLFEFGKPFFTYVFLIVQILLFIFLEVMGGSTDTTTLIKYGAKVNYLILQGEWWRFFTPIFLHIGILHLLMNSLALYYLGSLVERIFGSLRFLFIYIFSGFFGSLTSFIFSPSLSAGASGAIFGCFGALLLFGLIYPKLFFRTMGFNIIIVLCLNLLFGFTVPGIDNAGHLGGLLGGFLATGIWHFPKRKKVIMQTSFLFLSAIIAFSLLQFGYKHSSNAFNEQSTLMMAQEYIKKEDFEGAYLLLGKDLEGIKHSAQYYFLLSYAEIKLGKLEDAKIHLHKAIDSNENFHEAYYNLALIYENEQEYSNAKKYAYKAWNLEQNKKEYISLYNRLKTWESVDEEE